MNTNQKPDNYLVWAILTTILCCWPLGIVAIIKSTKVDSYWNAGQHDLAIQASNDAKKWSIISAICGAVGCILYAIFWLIYGFAMVGMAGGF